MTNCFNRRSFFLTFSGLAAAVASITGLRSRTARKENETQWIEPEAVAAALQEGADWVVIDVRNPDEFAGPMGHIRGAQNIPVDQLVTAPSDFDLPPGKRMVMVCLTDKRSARAAQALAARGFGHVFVLRGGMQRWTADRQPVEQAALQA